MIDIIIVTYNAKDNLRRCLKSIERHTRGSDFLITVVDNKSTDETEKFLKNLRTNINIIKSEQNFGFSKGANTGIRYTKNKYIVFLDDDTEVTSGWLNKLYYQIKNNSNVGIVGCKTIFPDKRIFHAGALATTQIVHNIGAGEIDNGRRNYIRDIDVVNGACWFTSRDVVDKVGYFDERFFPCQYEDIDYCLRTRLKGYKIIYNGEVTLIHHNLLRDGGREQNMGNYRKFRKKWNHILNKFPLKDSHPADKYITAGLDYLIRKRFKQAFIQFKNLESIDKRFSEPLFTGQALAGMAKYDKAIKEFKKDADLKPVDFMPHFCLWLCYEKTGRIRLGQEEYLNAIALNKEYFLNEKFAV